jgi:hypothetical protein
MNQQGAEDGFVLTSYNRTKTDQACIYIIHWSSDSREAFKEAERPAECCTIF